MKRFFSFDIKGTGAAELGLPLERCMLIKHQVSGIESDV